MKNIAKWAVGVIAAAGIVAGATAGASPAVALPPDGAGPSTPGTSSTVSPKSITAGGTISFTLRGFPAGEIAYIKIDDGNGYSNQALQGTGVVYQQKIASNGSVSGSFTLPGNIGNGSHWLRFLASKEVPDGDGVLGFTNHSPNFTVTGAASNGNKAAADGSGNRSVKNTSGQQANGTAQNSNGSGVATAVPTDGTNPEAQQTESATPSATPSATATSNSSENASAKRDGEGFPYLGVGIFAVVLIGGGIALWFALRKPRGARRHSADT